MSRLSANERDCLIVLLGGAIRAEARVSALAEAELVRCGDKLTPAGSELAYKVLAARLPHQTPELNTELLWAAAHARQGLEAPRRWLSRPECDGWYWVKPLDHEHLPPQFFDRPHRIESKRGDWLIGGTIFLNGRSVLPISLQAT